MVPPGLYFCSDNLNAPPPSDCDGGGTAKIIKQFIQSYTVVVLQYEL